MHQLRKFFLIELDERLLVCAKHLQFDAQLFRIRRRAWGLSHPDRTDADAARAHETVREEEEALRAPEHLHERDAGAMHELGMRERRATVRIDGVDVRRVRIRRLDVEHEPEPPQERVLKVSRGLPLPVLRHASLDVGHVRRLRRQLHGETRLERVAVRDVADLRHVRLDERQAVTFDRAPPHAQHVLDAPRRGAYPMELEVKDSRRVVDQVVVQNHGFCAVAFLCGRVRERETSRVRLLTRPARKKKKSLLC